MNKQQRIAIVNAYNARVAQYKGESQKQAQARRARIKATIASATAYRSAEPMRAHHIRMTDAHWAKFKRLGGASALRGWLDAQT